MNFAIPKGDKGNTNRVLKWPLEKFGVMDWVSERRYEPLPSFEATYFSTGRLTPVRMSLLMGSLNPPKPRDSVGENVYQNFASLEFSSIIQSYTMRMTGWNRIFGSNLPFTIDT